MHLIARVEVRIADVASADDRLHAIDDERLVVHAPVEAMPFDEELAGLGECGPIAETERVEQAHLDVRMRVERVEHAVLSADVEIVEQDAHAHAAIRSREDALRDEPAGRVVVEDVVLQVERMRGVVDQHDAAHQRIGVAEQRAESGIVVVLGDFGLHVTRRRCVGHRRDRGRRLARHVGTQCRAAARERAEQGEREQPREQVCGTDRGCHGGELAGRMLNASRRGRRARAQLIVAVAVRASRFSIAR